MIASKVWLTKKRDMDLGKEQSAALQKEMITARRKELADICSIFFGGHPNVNLSFLVCRGRHPNDWPS
jgi:hypothetical protein